MLYPVYAGYTYRYKVIFYINLSLILLEVQDMVDTEDAKQVCPCCAAVSAALWW